MNSSGSISKWLRRSSLEYGKGWSHALRGVLGFEWLNLCIKYSQGSELFVSLKGDTWVLSIAWKKVLCPECIMGMIIMRLPSPRIFYAIPKHHSYMVSNIPHLIVIL